MTAPTLNFDDLTPRTLDVGDRIRDFEFPDATGKRVMLDHMTLYGRPVVLHVTGDDDAARRELAALRDGFLPFGHLGVGVVAITRLSNDALLELFERRRPPFALLPDPSAQLFAYLGIDPGATAHILVAGPDLRVSHRLVGHDGRSPLGEALAACMARLTPAQDRLVAVQPPVLLLGDVFPPPLCQRLIEYWRRHSDRMVDVVTSGEAGGNVYDPGMKRRSDVPIDDPKLAGLIAELLKRRVLSEIHRYFGYAIREGETLKIGCYEATNEGRFRMHRDNNAGANLQRRFAMSLNLNDDFEGGILRFPEFPGIAYKPGVGAAVIFSCSLLHEATPVTRGRRFGVFGFFW